MGQRRMQKTEYINVFGLACFFYLMLVYLL